jgi:hypothetical protein
MLDDFFQYATELQQSLEQQGTLRERCSGSMGMWWWQHVHCCLVHLPVHLRISAATDVLRIIALQMPSAGSKQLCCAVYCCRCVMQPLPGVVQSSYSSLQPSLLALL